MKHLETPWVLMMIPRIPTFFFQPLVRGHYNLPRSINMNIETPWVLQYVSIIWDTIDTFGMTEYQIDMKMV
jgi:hypothetical protein